MNKVLLSAMAFIMCLFFSACGGADEDSQKKIEPVNQNVPVTAIESAPGEDIREVVVNEETDVEGKIFINSDFIAEALEDSMELDSKDFDFYHISSFSSFDRKTFKYYMVSEVQIYDGMASLIILGSSSGQQACWLVNYDKSNKYIDSLIIGYAGAGDENKIESVIDTKGAPYYINVTSVSPDSKEVIKVEVLSSGKFSEISRTGAGADSAV